MTIVVDKSGHWEILSKEIPIKKKHRLLKLLSVRKKSLTPPHFTRPPETGRVEKDKPYLYLLFK